MEHESNHLNNKVSNLDKWRVYTDGLISPDSFINFGFYYLIAASLQRRVWVGANHMPVFSNPYTVLVSDPGIGKGLVIKTVAKFLKHHKLTNPADKTTTITGDRDTGHIKQIEHGGTIIAVDRLLTETAALADYNAGLSEEERGSNFSSVKATEKPLLFPMGPDCTTFEALIPAMARALRRKNYVEYEPNLGRNLTKIYTHSSMAICLEELSSLFKKKTEDVANFFQIAYDCGDYGKDTKTQGKDRVKNCCLAFFAGTQPNFMLRAFGDGVLNEGFASRGWFIYESRNRKTTLHIPELNELQLQYEQDILEHIKNLSNLYGQVKFTKEAFDYLENWWIKSQSERPNISEKLLHYYARKNQHVYKMAMAVHFAEGLSMEISLDECKKALLLLNGIERKMHHALVSKSENPHYKLGLKILKFIEDSGARTLKELYARFWEESPGYEPRKAIDSEVEHYIVVGKIRDTTIDKITRYDILREEQIKPDEEDDLKY